MDTSQVTSPLDAEPETRRYRTIWISDLHLGTSGCKAEHLLDFLRRNDAQTLYLVGDIVDGWRLKKRYSHAHFLGPMSHEELARHYRLADVFVFPSLTDTFGLVLLEAMACGCPVAALPAGSTRDVLGDSGAGVIHSDLRVACLQALETPRHIPLQHARKFSWQATTRIFFKHLQPIGSYSTSQQACTH